jgi:tetratricopeptide (TPR) repeat protein
MAKLYVIRFKDRKESAPISESDVRALILSGEINEDDNISVYPDQFASNAKSYPEFEELFKDDEKTSMIDSSKIKELVYSDKTRIFEKSELSISAKQESSLSIYEEAPDVDSRIKHEKTGLIEIPGSLKKTEEVKKKSPLPKFSVLLMALIALLIQQQYEEEDEEAAAQKKNVVMMSIKPTLPNTSLSKKPDPIASEKVYKVGLRDYYEDTVKGYRKAADQFHLSLKHDPQNVMALSMLASTYLNLIESSNQDENTFSVINKLIDLSKVKQAETVETVIAELEFLIASKRYDAAMQKLTEYAKITNNSDARVFYYIGLVFHLKGNNTAAFQNLNLIPINNFPVPKLFYLLGQIYEDNGQLDEAIAEYKRALKANKEHARSRLGFIRIMEKKGALKSKEVVQNVEFLTAHPSLQSPKEYIDTLIFRSKVALIMKNSEIAVQSLQQALKIKPKNEELKLEYYTLMSQLGADKKYKSLAQMYSLVLQGEKYAKDGQTHEAVAVFIQAKDTFPRSEVPLEKMGDLFYQLGEFTKAMNNYKSAIKSNPKALHIAVKLINSAIKSQDWEEASKQLSKFRGEKSLKSAIDRLAGDLAAKQGLDQQAVTLYLKAMNNNSIDTEVYSAYADILRKNDRCKDAQFFYTVAQKFDPLSLDAISGSAKCLLKTDGIKLAVTRIQDELSRLPKAKADLLSAISDVYLLSGDDENAINFADQAIAVDPLYPESYRIKGIIYSNKMQIVKESKESKKNALEMFQLYSARKPSDTFGFLNRFEIFLKDSNFEMAAEELNRIFEVSPRFPELHFRRALMFSKMGKTKDALAELEEELKINSKSIKALDERGYVLLRLNQLDEALKSFVRSMELESRNANSKMGAGYVNYLKRQFNSAIALYQAALSLDKGNPDIHKKLGQAYRDSGDQQKASQYFRNYLDLAPDAPDHSDYEQYR